jgi:hypothetical protein
MQETPDDGRLFCFGGGNIAVLGERIPIPLTGLQCSRTMCNMTKTEQPKKQLSTTGIRLNEEDRSALATAKRILEKENKGVRYSLGAILRAALYFFVDQKNTK